MNSEKYRIYLVIVITTIITMMIFNVVFNNSKSLNLVKTSSRAETGQFTGNSLEEDLEEGKYYKIIGYPILRITRPLKVVGPFKTKKDYLEYRVILYDLKNNIIFNRITEFKKPVVTTDNDIIKIVFFDNDIVYYDVMTGVLTEESVE